MQSVTEWWQERMQINSKKSLTTTINVKFICCWNIPFEIFSKTPVRWHDTKIREQSLPEHTYFCAKADQSYYHFLDTSKSLIHVLEVQCHGMPKRWLDTNSGLRICLKTDRNFQFQCPEFLQMISIIILKNQLKWKS